MLMVNEKPLLINLLSILKSQNFENIYKRKLSLQKNY